VDVNCSGEFAKGSQEYIHYTQIEAGATYDTKAFDMLQAAHVADPQFLNYSVAAAIEDQYKSGFATLGRQVAWTAQATAAAADTVWKSVSQTGLAMLDGLSAVGGGVGDSASQIAQSRDQYGWGPTALGMATALPDTMRGVGQWNPDAVGSLIGNAAVSVGGAKIFSVAADTAAANGVVDLEVSALQRIASNNAVDTGSAARMARIDQMAENNYNRLLMQDLNTQSYVYRGVNANMIDIYEAQGGISGRGGSPTYFSLDVGDTGGVHMLGAQMPSPPQVMLKIPTSELVGPTVPRPEWGGAPTGWEYYTNSYPKWGPGGYRQFVGTTNSFSRDWIVPGWSN
jgi:hypothetical protein